MHDSQNKNKDPQEVAVVKKILSPFPTGGGGRALSKIKIKLILVCLVWKSSSQ